MWLCDNTSCHVWRYNLPCIGAAGFIANISSRGWRLPYTSTPDHDAALMLQSSSWVYRNYTDNSQKG